MIRYESAIEGFQEIPNEVSLLINLTNCQNNCEGCHSPQLRQNSGKPMTALELTKLLSQGAYSCVCVMGEGRDKHSLLVFLNDIRHRGLKVALYCGRDIDIVDWCREYSFYPDYLKVGSYQEKLGPLNSKTTNQRLYKRISLEDETYRYEDITFYFQRDKEKINEFLRWVEDSESQ